MNQLERHILLWIKKRSDFDDACNFKFLQERADTSYPGNWEDFAEKCLPTLKSLVTRGSIGEHQLPTEYMPRLFLIESGKQAIENL